jgi:hypothetical protein
MNIKQLASAILIVLGIVVNTYPHYYVQNGDVYCTWIAGSFVLFALALAVLQETLLFGLIAEIAFVLSVNNFADEYYRIALVKSNWEYEIVGLLTLITLYRSYRKWKGNKRLL